MTEPVKQARAPKGLPQPETDPDVTAEVKAEGAYGFLGRADLIGLLRHREEQGQYLRLAITNLRQEVKKLNLACYKNRGADLRVAEQRRINERLRTQNNNQLHALEEAGRTIETQAGTIKDLTKRIDDLLSKIASTTPPPTTVGSRK